MIKIKQTLTLLGLLIFGLASNNIFACSCIGESSIEGAYKNSALVASGQVINITTEWVLDKEVEELGFSPDKLNEMDKRVTGFYFKKILIKIENIFKGHITNDTLIIYTGSGGGDCGYNFITGQKYVIYGSTGNYLVDVSKNQNFPSGKNIYWTNICTRTQKYNLAEIEELEKINEQNNLSSNTLKKTLIKQQWRIDASLKNINKIDSSFMWSDYGDKEIWQHVNKETHSNLDCDIKFKKNGKLFQLGIYGNKKKLTWKEIGLYTIENSIIKFQLVNNITAEFRIVKLADNVISLREIKK